MLESVIVEREEGTTVFYGFQVVYFCDPWDRENFHFELISTQILTTGQTQHDLGRDSLAFIPRCRFVLLVIHASTH